MYPVVLRGDQRHLLGTYDDQNPLLSIAFAFNYDEAKGTTVIYYKEVGG